MPTSPTATCNICNVKVARGIDKVGKFDTTNLNKHLQKHHAKGHAELRVKPAESTTRDIIIRGDISLKKSPIEMHREAS